MTDQPDDPEFEQYLAGASRVSREYGALPREEPPAALDIRIRAAAADAVKASGRSRRPALWWLRPAALAATVLVSFALMVELGELPQRTASPGVDAEMPPVQVRMMPPENRAASRAPDSAPLLAPSGEIAPATPPLAESDETYEPPAQEIITTAVKREDRLADVPVAVAAIEPERLEESGFASHAAKPPLGSAAADAAKPSPETAPAASGVAATFSPSRIDSAMLAIRSRLGEVPERKGVEEMVVTQRRDAAAANEKESAPLSADERLRAILALHDQGQDATVPTALADFARDFPDDPLTALLTAPPE